MGLSADGNFAAMDEADSPSPWLRTWIEFQVDARVNQAVRDLIEGELAKVAHLDEVRVGADRVQEEVRVVAQNQAKLLQVVEGISAEVSEAGERATRQQQDLVDLGRGVQQLETKLSVWRTEVATEVRASAMRDKGDAESLRLEAQAAASARTDFEERLEGLRLEVLSATRSWTDFERRMEHGHRLLADRLDNSHRKLAERTESWMEGMGQDLHARENRLASDLRQGLRKEAIAEIRSELRADITTELSGRVHRQQEATLALEEQLWLMDKRLGARIDEMMQSQAVMDHYALKSQNTQDARRRCSSNAGNRSARTSATATPLAAGPERRAAAGMLAAAVEALRDDEQEAEASSKRLDEDGLAFSSATASVTSPPGGAAMQRSRSAGRRGNAWRGRLALGPESQTRAITAGEVEVADHPALGISPSDAKDYTRASFLALESMASSLQAETV